MSRPLPVLVLLALAVASCEDPPPGGWPVGGAYVDPGLVDQYNGGVGTQSIGDAGVVFVQTDGGCSTPPDAGACPLCAEAECCGALSECPDAGTCAPLAVCLRTYCASSCPEVP